MVTSREQREYYITASWAPYNNMGDDMDIFGIRGGDISSKGVPPHVKSHENRQVVTHCSVFRWRVRRDIRLNTQ